MAARAAHPPRPTGTAVVSRVGSLEEVPDAEDSAHELAPGGHLRLSHLHTSGQRGQLSHGSFQSLRMSLFWAPPPESPREGSYGAFDSQLDRVVLARLRAGPCFSTRHSPVSPLTASPFQTKHALPPRSKEARWTLCLVHGGGKGRAGWPIVHLEGSTNMAWTAGPQNLQECSRTWRSHSSAVCKRPRWRPVCGFCLSSHCGCVTWQLSRAGPSQGPHVHLVSRLREAVQARLHGVSGSQARGSHSDLCSMVAADVGHGQLSLRGLTEEGEAERQTGLRVAGRARTQEAGVVAAA